MDGPTSAAAAAAAGAAAAAFYCCYAARGNADLALLAQSQGTVVAMRRFAVKGLSGDALQTATLGVGETFRDDRRFAMLKGSSSVQFDPSAPEWVHKKEFHCTFSDPKRCASLQTSFDSDKQVFTLGVKGEAGGPRGSWPVAESWDAATAALRSVFDDPALRVITTAVPHQFGNTQGLKKLPGGRLLHIVNLRTVSDLSAKCGRDLGHERFRGNIVIDGPAPWVEFKWVGRRVAIGTAVVEVTGRTVRCLSTTVRPDRDEDSYDVPAALSKHFPEHGPYLGVYAKVVQAGEITAGAALRLLP